MDNIVLSLEGEESWFISLSVTWACGRFLNDTQPKSAEGSAAWGIFFPALFGEREVSGKRSSLLAARLLKGR